MCGVVLAATLLSCASSPLPIPNPEPEVRTIQIIRGSGTSLVLQPESEFLAQSKRGQALIEVTRPPTHGVLRKTRTPGTFVYQHGGATKQDDSFEYQWIQADGSVSTQRVHLTFKARSAKVLILSPKPGEVLQPGAIEVRYKTQGQDFNHLHISLDNTGHNTIRDLSGKFTLTEVPPGRHRITAQLVDSNHRPIATVGAQHEISVIVK